MADYPWSRVGLRGRLFVTLAALVLITMAGGAVMIWFTYRMDSLNREIIEVNFSALQIANELETALANQKGYVSYYFMDGDETWLNQLSFHRKRFLELIEKARSLKNDTQTADVLDRIESLYADYTRSKDRVIELYAAGRKQEGERLHESVRRDFDRLLRLTGEYKSIYKAKIEAGLTVGMREAARLRATAVAAMAVALLTAAALAFILTAQILEPIRRIASEAFPEGVAGRPRDEVAALRSSVHGLIDDMDSTHVELERSRRKLLQSEKMALVGKLAAEVAHSVRNPLTSIKMRLFSLQKALQLSPSQREDLDVVSQEMKRLDDIVRNFLEFSRPPKLRKIKTDIPEVVEASLQLLKSRFEKDGIEVKRHSRPNLPPVDADPELLKEALVNLLVNACDSMQDGGSITITEEEAVAENLGKVVALSVADTGPGISENLLEKVWEPFFSTKEDGTGLGLSIAERIVEEHGGRIEVRSRIGEGTTFLISLPSP